MPILQSTQDWIAICTPWIGASLDALLEPQALPTFYRPLWPASGFIGLNTGVAPLVRIRMLSPRIAGGSGHKRIAGVTKDSSDAPLAGVTCKAFRSTDDVANSRYVDQREGTIGISDAAGNYEVMVPTTDTYQIQTYKAGSPDVAGCTVNTLVGT